ncbi:MAG: NAD(P)/FAD-dependent oxidoreductase [Acidobacteriota bacterium]
MPTSAIPASEHRIVIVGGGAGGLELATRLGDSLTDSKIQVVLVDASLTHIWKPLLHEVAAGSLDTGNNEIDYLAHARQHGFQFHLGSMESLDRQQKQIWLNPIVDDTGQRIAERRAIGYHTLVMAIGSLVNDFHTPGVAEHALSLNSVDDARNLHKHVLAACLRMNEGVPTQTDIAIVGGGATGVELAAELHQTLQEYARYTDAKASGQSRITLIEAGKDILAHLPDALRSKVKAELQAKPIRLMTETQVKAVQADGVQTANGGFIGAQIVVWAAGVKGPDLLTRLDGLDCNKINQLVVRPTLQTTRDEHIFALGDCAAFTPKGQDKPIPPLAQAAHQQALYLARVLPLHVQGQTTLPEFVYKSHGALISLGTDKAVGNVVGRLTGHRFEVDGWVARWSYRALYRGYLAGLHGWLRMVLTTLGDWLTQSTKSRVKLH